MALPDAVPTVRLQTSTPLALPDGTPYRGSILITGPDLVTVAGEDLVLGGAVTAPLAGGVLAVDLVPSDITSMDPTGWTYELRSQFTNAPNWTRHVVITSASETVELAEILEADPVAGEYSVLVRVGDITAADVGADPAGAAATAVDDHEGQADAHGDRAWASSQFDAAGAAAAAIADAANKYVDLTGNQTVGGEKTFTEFYPVAAIGVDPAFDNQLVPLHWVRDNFLSSTGDVIGRTRAVHKTADEQVTSSIALQDDDHLALAVAANAVYALDTYLDAEADPAADITLGWSAPAGTTMSWTEGGISAGNGNNIGSIKLQRNDVATSSGIGLLATGSAAMPRGVVRTGGTAGTLRLRWAQTATSGTPTILKAGSWLRLHRIA